MKEKRFQYAQQGKLSNNVAEWDVRGFKYE
jgi:hypothetical protein